MKVIWLAALAPLVAGFGSLPGPAIDICNYDVATSLDSDEGCAAVLTMGLTCDATWYTICGTNHPSGEDFNFYQLTETSCSSCGGNPNYCSVCGYGNSVPEANKDIHVGSYCDAYEEVIGDTLWPEEWGGVRDEASCMLASGAWLHYYCGDGEAFWLAGGSFIPGSCYWVQQDYMAAGCCAVGDQGDASPSAIYSFANYANADCSGQAWSEGEFEYPTSYAMSDGGCIAPDNLPVSWTHAYCDMSASPPMYKRTTYLGSDCQGDSWEDAYLADGSCTTHADGSSSTIFMCV